jgi:hypothetical protein
MPHFPILDTRKSINAIHDMSPILFWTIGIVSSRFHGEHSSCFLELKEAYLELLSTTLVKAIRSVHTIQALLIICLWPLPVKKQIYDPSWGYCSLAVSAALQIGLHQSGSQWEYGFHKLSARDVEFRTKTWLGCFLVNT